MMEIRTNSTAFDMVCGLVVSLILIACSFVMNTVTRNELIDRIDAMKSPAPTACPACKLRAEADTQASPGSVATLAEPGEFIPEPRELSECR